MSRIRRTHRRLPHGVGPDVIDILPIETPVPRVSIEDTALAAEQYLGILRDVLEADRHPKLVVSKGHIVLANRAALDRFGGREALTSLVAGSEDGSQAVKIRAYPLHAADDLLVLELEDPGTNQLGGELDRTTASLRQSEAELATIIENLREGVVVASLDGRLLLWNRAALEMHGFANLDECRRVYAELGSIFELEDESGVILDLEHWPIARILDGEHLHDYQVRVTRRTMASWSRIFSYSGGLARAPDGRPLLAVVTVNDITRLKERERWLRESEERLSMVLDGSDDGFWDFDLVARRYTFSRRCRELIGEPTGTGLESFRFWWSRLHPDDRGPLHDLLAQIERDRAAPIDLDFRLRHADGTFRWMRARGKVVVWSSAGEPRRAAGTLRDVSVRRAAQESLRSTLQENEALVTKLRGALESVRTLETLLPICAWCGRIKNEAGQYEKMDEYICRHTETRFTHSMCPECFGRLHSSS